MQSFDIELRAKLGGGRGGGEEAEHRLFKFVVGLAYASVYPLCPQNTWKD
jgi:hypothetical protein